MKRALPLALVMTLCLGPVIATAQEASISPEEAQSVCRYAKDAYFGGDKSYVWTDACGAAEPNVTKLVEIQRYDDMMDYGYAEARTGGEARQAEAERLYELFTTSPLFVNTEDDSYRPDSQTVRKCMTKLGCEYATTVEEVEALDDIEPPITARTFPIWLATEKANKMLPFFLIAENERLRVEKYNTLRVPLEEDAREEFCEEAANAGRCAQFAQIQKQLETNKTVINALQGIIDPDEFAAYIGEGQQREASDGTGSLGVLAQWSAARDDSSLPFKPEQTHSPDGTVPPEAAAAQAESQEEQGWTSWALGVGGAAIAGTLAWSVRKKRFFFNGDAGDEIAAEDTAAMADPNAVKPLQAGDPGLETMGLSSGEIAAYEAWQASDQSSLEAYLESKYQPLGITSAMRAHNSLLAKIQTGTYLNQVK